MASPGFGKDMFSNLKTELPAQLPAYLKGQRWFGAKARELRAAEVVDFITLERDALHALIVMVKVEYEGGGADLYSVPLVVTKDPGSNLKGEPGAPGKDAGSNLTNEPGTPSVSSAGTATVLTVSGRSSGEKVTLTDALKNEAFLSFLLDAIERGLVFTGEVGQLVTLRTHALSLQETGAAGSLRPRAITAEQSNSSVAYGDRLILKFFRRLEEGVNPDLEVGGFLTEKAHYQHTPQLLGALEYRGARGLRMTQGILQGFVPNQGDAWQYTMKSISAFYNEVGKSSTQSAVVDGRNDAARALIAPFLESVGLLARRTAELHLALGSPAAPTEADFAPEPFDDKFQRSFEDALLELTNRIFGQLRHAQDRLPENAKPKVEKVLGSEPQIIERFHAALSAPIRAVRTRIHGDYHLGQVLYTGADFVIIDFEGEPARPLSQRRLKRSPLQDVAGMLRSFHYAAHAPLLASTGSVNVDDGNREKLNGWAEVWGKWISDRFLEEYLKTARGAEFLPPSREEIMALLQLHVLEKAVYELGYELNNRPDWVAIPLEGISKTLESSNL
ncbi:MAG TPA: putative maltokinase [Methylomirabilota bacterium]|nr:putative maltokinase [Methylomirabilota bacterium]